MNAALLATILCFLPTLIIIAIPGIIAIIIAKSMKNKREKYLVININMNESQMLEIMGKGYRKRYDNDNNCIYTWIYGYYMGNIIKCEIYVADGKVTKVNPINC